MSANPYHRLSVEAKIAYANAHLVEPPLRCPACMTALQPADLLGHLDTRCPGQPAPGPASRWIPHREAIRLVPRGTLHHWASRGVVRARGASLSVTSCLLWRCAACRAGGCDDAAMCD